MANTTFITNIIEPKMIEWVSFEIKQNLLKKRVHVGVNSNKKPVSFEFDGISTDGKTVCLASATNSNKEGQIRKLFRDAVILLNYPASRRIMVFLEDGRHVWETFFADNDGIIELTKIDPMFCRLSDELMISLNESRASAKLEVGDLGRVRPVKSGRK